MTRADNSRLQSLDRRLQDVYNNAYKRALERERIAISRLARIYADTTLTDEERERHLRSTFYRLDHETGLAQNIAREIANASDTARRMIDGASLNLFISGYQSQFNDIVTQVQGAGIKANWSLMDRNALNAIFNGEHTALGQLEGFQSAFTMVGYREIEEFSLDRTMVRHYYDRSFGRLGDNAEIVRRLQNQLAEAVILGESIPDITQRVRGVCNMSYRQARRIARTETLRAANQGRYLAADHVHKEHNLPMLKKWHTALDERTRRTPPNEFDHAEASGQTVKFEDFFVVGGENLKYPLDPNGSAGNTINCRCIATYTVDLEALKQQRLETESQSGYDREPQQLEEPATQQPISNDDGSILEIIDFGNKPLVQSTLEKYEREIVELDHEVMIVIATNGNVYRSDGNESTVLPPENVDLTGAYVTHNHPVDVSEFSFSHDDYSFFFTNSLEVLRGIDEKYVYELRRNAGIAPPLPDTPVSQLSIYNTQHHRIAMEAREDGFYYEREQRSS